MGFISTANRKRPQDFDDLEGQGFIVTTIRNAIENSRFAHAYLFAGPRGVGKTTSARLLAKSLNCEKGPTIHPCNKCASCLGIASSSSTDCIEIDGASNTSVDDIRKIRSDIMYPPSSRFKIYIIDEVHMLSNSAFNALLKTIEEPPDYAIFIFATTEIQKVPQTIKSRCQFFRFKAIDLELVKKRIKSVCDEMKISIDEQSLSYIARESEGSMRDAYTIFDQLSSFSGNDIRFSKIEKELLLTPYAKIADILACAAKEDAKGALEVFFELQNNGVRHEQFVRDFAFFVRSMLLRKSGITDSDVLYFDEAILSRPEFGQFTADNLNMVLDDLLALYRDMRYSVNPSFDCELFLTNLARIKFRLSNFEIAKRLAAYETSVLDDQPDTVASEPVPMRQETPKQESLTREAPAVSSRSEERRHVGQSPSRQKAAAKMADESRGDDVRVNSETSEYIDEAAEHDIVLDIFRDGLTDPI